MATAFTKKLTGFITYMTGRYVPAFVTLLLLAGAFFFYFHVIVGKNESELKERSFRGLHRMARNIARKTDVYQEQNAAHFLKSYNDAAGNPDRQSVIRKEYGLDMETVAFPEANDTRFFIDPAQGGKLFFRNAAGNRAATSSVGRFIEPLLRRDLFNHYLLAVDSTIVFDELNLTYRDLNKLLPETTSVSTAGVVPPRYSGRISEVEIGGKLYKLFVLPFYVSGQYRFCLGAYMHIDQYEAEQKYLPSYFILWMVMGLLLVALMFPLLKVFLINGTEQLLTRNVAASLAAVHLAGGVFILVALNVFVYFFAINGSVSERLKKLGDEVSKTFKEEVDAGLRELDEARHAIGSGVPLTDLVFSPEKDAFLVHEGPGNKEGKPAKEKTFLYKPGEKYAHFRHITWTGKDGMQAYRWTRNDYLPEKINISNRDYFRAISRGDAWRRANGEPYYVTAISSWVSDSTLAIISAPVTWDSGANKGEKELAVVSLSGSFQSVFRPVLPFGFGFAVIRGNGDVLFHSDTRRSLNENLLEECDGEATFQSILQTNASGYFSSRYGGSNNRFYIRPLPGTPYSVVTFRDMKPIWSEDLDVISACSILALVNLGVILLAIVLIQAGGYRTSLLQSKSYQFSWLRPKKTLKSSYSSMSYFFWISIPVQAFFLLVSQRYDAITMVGITFSYSFALLTAAYHQYGREQKEDGASEVRSSKALPYLLALYVVPVVLFLTRLGWDSAEFWIFFFSQLTLVFTYLLATSHDLFGVTHRKNYRWWYVQSLFSFIAATAIMPMIIFYFLCYKQERLLSLKRSQMDLADQLIRKRGEAALAGRIKDTVSYLAPVHFNLDKEYVDPLDKVSEDPLEADGYFDHLYRSVKPSFSLYSEQMEQMGNLSENAGNFNWTQNRKEGTIRLQHRFPNAPKVHARTWGFAIHSPLYSPTGQIASVLSKYLIYSLISVGMLIILLWLLYFLLRQLIWKIFFFGYENNSVGRDANALLSQTLLSEGNVFVYGPIGSGKSRLLKKALKLRGRKLYEEDTAGLLLEEPEKLFSRIEAKQRDGGGWDGRKEVRPLVLISHFEIGASDGEVTRKKLVLLEGMLRRNWQIVVLSSRSFEFLQSVAEHGSNPGALDYRERWTQIMNNFYTLYHHWSVSGAAPDAGRKQQVHQELRDAVVMKLPVSLRSPGALRFLDDQVNRFLDGVDEECRHNDFLWNIRGNLLEHFRKHKADYARIQPEPETEKQLKQVLKRHYTELFEKTCLKIQMLASNNYLSIWQSMNREEQRTLYDIALDEIVNPCNRKMAAQLADLGLVSPMKDVACYQIMNHSFRNFIFTQLDREEVKSFHKEAEEKGSWSSFQLPLIIVVIGLSIFLYTTQRDAFTNLVSYLGAGVAGIAGLLKLLGLIPHAKT